MHRTPAHSTPDQSPDYADLFENAPVGYMLLDESGLVEGLNLTAAAILGLDRSLVVGQPFEQWVAQDDQPLLHAHLGQVRACRERVSQLLRVRNRHGRLIELRLVSVGGRTSTGAPNCRCIMIDSSGEPETQHEKGVAAERASRLTERERQVMKLVVSDLSNKEIARHLMISPRTVEHHREHVMAKMEAHSIADLVTMAVLCGIHPLSFPANARGEAHESLLPIRR